MALRILKSEHDGITGRTTMHIRVEEETAPGKITQGPPETISIEPRALMLAYHGQVKPTPESISAAMEKWLAERHREALERKRHADMTRSVAASLNGKLLTFDIPPEAGE